jgi:hypothetical protein
MVDILANIVAFLIIIVLPLYLMYRLIKWGFTPKKKYRKSTKEKITPEIQSYINENQDKTHLDLTDATNRTVYNTLYKDKPAAKEITDDDSDFKLIDSAETRQEAMDYFYEMKREGVYVSDRAYARAMAWKEYQQWLSEEEYEDRLAKGLNTRPKVWEYAAEKAVNQFLKKNKVENRIKTTREILTPYLKLKKRDLYKEFSDQLFNRLLDMWKNHRKSVKIAQVEFDEQQAEYKTFKPERYLEQLNEVVMRLYNDEVKTKTV